MDAILYSLPGHVITCCHGKIKEKANPMFLCIALDSTLFLISWRNNSMVLSKYFFWCKTLVMCWDEKFLSHLWNRTMILTLNSSVAWMWLLSQALGEVKLNLVYWLLRPIFQILSWAKPTNILLWSNHQNTSTTIHEFIPNLSKDLNPNSL